MPTPPPRLAERTATVSLSQADRLRGKRALAAASALLALCGVALLDGRSAALPAKDRAYDEHVRPFLVKHCQGCHDGWNRKGGFLLSDLPASLDSRESQRRWLAVI